LKRGQRLGNRVTMPPTFLHVMALWTLVRVS
jgi:hypothetical protein